MANASVWMAGWVSTLNPSKHKSPDGVVRKLLLALLIRNGELDKSHFETILTDFRELINVADSNRLRSGCQIKIDAASQHFLTHAMSPAIVS
jgi:hypothetical protein